MANETKENTNPRTIDELLKSKLVQLIALTTTVFAVIAAISSAVNTNVTTESGVLTEKQNNGWSYYQAKSIKGYLYQLQADILALEDIKAESKEAKAEIAKLMAPVKQKLTTYESEKDAIKADIEKMDVRIKVLEKRSSNFGTGLLNFEIAIVLVSVGAIFSMTALWLLGLGLGLVGAAYIVNGYLAFF